MPVIMACANLVKELKPVLLLAEGWADDLYEFLPRNDLLIAHLFSEENPLFKKHFADQKKPHC